MTSDSTACRAQLLDPADPAAHRLLEDLRADATIEFIDRRAEQIECLRRLCPAPGADLLEEPSRWAFYPWRRTVVGVLGPRGFRTLRLDRNRNLVTTDEQSRLGLLRVGVAGLSVGHVIAHTLAMQGMSGAIRLADFDSLELSNLNRVPATVFDLGVNKAIAAARRIAELDPYLDVEVMTLGVTVENVDAFLDGLDVVVEECDSFDVKALLREKARDRRLPVVMATSDRGLFDVERFDIEPQRPILHGFLGELDAPGISRLAAHERIGHMLRHLDASQSSPRLTASLVEVGQSLSTWPQLAGEVTLGAVTVAEAVRRIGLGKPLPSGQTRIDIGAALDDLREPEVADDISVARPDPAEFGSAEVDPIAFAANRAPSGGNAQPWRIESRPDSVLIQLVPDRSSLMDVGFRGSAVALGAAMFNARVAASAHRLLGPVVWGQVDGRAPLEAVLRLEEGGSDPRLTDLYEPMLRRETNRRRGSSEPIAEGVVAELIDEARREGANLSLLTSPDQLRDAADLFAAADRIRYLTPRLHEQMFGELRWPGDPDPDVGLDVRSLELDSGDLATLEVLRRPDVMAQLARWDGGAALGEDTGGRIAACAALAVVTVSGSELIDFSRAGAAAEAVWIAAQRHGLAVQPISPTFLHAVHQHELWELSPQFAAELGRLQTEFRRLAGTAPDESQALVLRLTRADPPSLRSRRRSCNIVTSWSTD